MTNRQGNLKLLWQGRSKNIKNYENKVIVVHTITFFGEEIKEKDIPVRMSLIMQKIGEANRKEYWQTGNVEIPIEISLYKELKEVTEEEKAAADSVAKRWSLIITAPFVFLGKLLTKHLYKYHITWKAYNPAVKTSGLQSEITAMSYKKAKEAVYTPTVEPIPAEISLVTIGTQVLVRLLPVIVQFTLSASLVWIIMRATTKTEVYKAVKSTPQYIVGGVIAIGLIGTAVLINYFKKQKAF